MIWLDSPAHTRWLESEMDRLLAFGVRSSQSGHGFGWLDDDGRIDENQPRQLWINCRMTHCFAIGALMGRPGFAPLVDEGLAAIDAVFGDPENGGWFGQVSPAGVPSSAKEAYPHAFVVLAASSAVQAGRPGAAELLLRALEIEDRHFWDEEAGLVREEWDASFTTCDPYRGVNANMHTVEAYLAASDATGDDVWRARAGRIIARVLDFARGNEWRIPEHFDTQWHPELEFNSDRKADPFRPYGATIGHSYEWARLALHVDSALGDSAPAGLQEAARSLFALATREGWSVDGASGFVYTVDWQGNPVVHNRMHWVACEAVGAAATLFAVTGEVEYADRYREWWDYCAQHLIDPERGSWRHELDRSNAPSSDTWRGKPDIYHALQTTLVPRLPLAPSLSAALAQGLLR